MRFLLTGSTGQVGGELAEQLEALGSCVPLDRGECDLLQPDKLSGIIDHHEPNAIVNAAAYTAVDQAEDEPELAMLINGEAVGVLAREATLRGILLVHYSTDYVFDGTKSSPYTEDDPPCPINAYGRSKFAGEEAIRESGCSYCIIRTSWVHSHRGENFIKSILRLARNRASLRIVADQVGTPTSAALIAKVTCSLLRTLPERMQETVHVTASGETNWYEYAKLVVRKGLELGLPTKLAPDRIVPITTAEYVTAADRPLNSRLCTTKLDGILGVGQPDWRVAVAETIEGIIRCRC